MFTGEKKEYSACPVIRYFAPYYYVIYLHAAIPGHNGWVSFMARSKDLATWQLSPMNPILEAGAGEGATTPTSTCSSGKAIPTCFTPPATSRPGAVCAWQCIPARCESSFESYFPEDRPTTKVSAVQ